MGGIVIITMDITSMDVEAKSRLDNELVALGLQKTLPETKGGTLRLPEGTYGSVIEFDDKMNCLKHYYRSLFGIMRNIIFKGKYFVTVADNPAFVCGEL